MACSQLVDLTAPPAACPSEEEQPPDRELEGDGEGGGRAEQQLRRRPARRQQRLERGVRQHGRELSEEHLLTAPPLARLGPAAAVDTLAADRTVAQLVRWSRKDVVSFQKAATT